MVAFQEVYRYIIKTFVSGSKNGTKVVILLFSQIFYGRILCQMTGLSIYENYKEDHYSY